MATLGFKDNDGLDVGDKYVTKEYLIDRYPNIATHSNMPSLWSWGLGTNGQLGDNVTVTNRSTSSPGTVFAGATNWKTVDCGSNSAAGIRQDGSLWTWGNNAVGQLGSGNTTARSSPQTTAGTNLTTWVKISCGSSHLAAIQNNGSLWTWGEGTYGKLGSNATTNRSSPVTTAGAPAAGAADTWQQVACGSNFTLGIKTDGVLYSWGRNVEGQLGINTTTPASRTSPASAVPSTVLNTWNFISAGGDFGTGITNDGRLWTWGFNSLGSLGDGSTTNRSSPQTVAGGGTNWKLVCCGAFHAVAVKTDGSLWTWGQNTSGQLGDGSTTNRSSPQTVAGGGLNWVRVHTGSFIGGVISGGIKSDGSLWNWGYNVTGGLGDGTSINKSSPVTTVLNVNSWKVIAIGDEFTLGIKEEDDW
jgi:alpha-tubulin suppressor-like RCC1 family protein